MAQKSKLFEPEPIDTGFDPEPITTATPAEATAAAQQKFGDYSYKAPSAKAAPAAPRRAEDPAPFTIKGSERPGALAGATRGVANTLNMINPGAYADQITENAVKPLAYNSKQLDSDNAAIKSYVDEFAAHPVREGVTQALNMIPVVGPWAGGLFNRAAKGDKIGALTEAATSLAAPAAVERVVNGPYRGAGAEDLTPTRKQIANLEGVVGKGAPKELSIKNGVPQTGENLAQNWQPMAKTQMQKLGVTPKDIQKGGVFGRETAPKTDLEGNLGRGLTSEKHAEVADRVGHNPLPLGLELAEGAVRDADTNLRNVVKPFHEVPVENLLAPEVGHEWNAEKAGQPGGVVSSSEGVGPNNNIQTQLMQDLSAKAAEYAVSDPPLSAAYKAAASKVGEMGHNVKGLLDLKSHAIKESSRYNTMGQTAATNASAGPGYAWKYLADNIRNKLYPSLEAMGAPPLREMGQNEVTAIQARDGLFQEYQKTKIANAVESRQGWLGRLVKELPVESRALVSAPARATMLGRLVRGNPLPMSEFNRMLAAGIGPTEGFVPPEVPQPGQLRLAENAGPDIYGFNPPNQPPAAAPAVPSAEGLTWNAAEGVAKDPLASLRNPSGVAPTGGVTSVPTPVGAPDQFAQPSGVAPRAGVPNVVESRPPVNQFASPSGVAPRGPLPNAETVVPKTPMSQFDSPSGAAPKDITPVPTFVGAPDQFAAPSGVAPTQGIRPIPVPPPTLAGVQTNMPGALPRPENAIQAESYYPGKAGMEPQMLDAETPIMAEPKPKFVGEGEARKATNEWAPDEPLVHDYTNQPQLFGVDQTAVPAQPAPAPAPQAPAAAPAALQAAPLPQAEGLAPQRPAAPPVAPPAPQGAVSQQLIDMQRKTMEHIAKNPGDAPKFAKVLADLEREIAKQKAIAGVQ